MSFKIVTVFFFAVNEPVHAGDFSSCDIAVPALTNQRPQRVDTWGDFSKVDYDHFVFKLSNLFTSYGYTLKLVTVSTHGDEVKSARYFLDVSMEHIKAPYAKLMIALNQNPDYGTEATMKMPFIYAGWENLFDSRTKVSTFHQSVYGPLPKSAKKVLVSGFRNFKQEFENRMSNCH